ncbi:hypothetical protein PR048_005194 [Dryococelus australis]|uniref:PiggyBac transposable element-derived protein domain-containing protein n=1 Tax=Dryococelus australis TaxID=614101 RepID=A0ABQ9I9N0_9NEOP|nr:hypothetical protein PR048_005194 [Dryococelus australis]
MVPFKGQLSIEQYIKNKLHKWGVKLFMLCGESGLVYNFFIYQGQTTELPENISPLGHGVSVVLHPSERALLVQILRGEKREKKRGGGGRFVDTVCSANGDITVETYTLLNTGPTRIKHMKMCQGQKLLRSTIHQWVELTKSTYMEYIFNILSAYIENIFAAGSGLLL